MSRSTLPRARSSLRRAAAVWMGLLSMGVVGLPEAAFAELFRCVRSDGSVVFTDSRSGCVQARPQSLRRQVQTVSPPASRRRTAAARELERHRGSLEHEAESGEATLWRGRKRQAEQELLDIERKRARLVRFVTHCNRGGEIFGRDKTSGLKHGVSCQDVRSNFETLASRGESVRAYLEEGIYEDCRRAGCLPGWLR